MPEYLTKEELDINYEELWGCSFFKKIFRYLRKQPVYKRKLTDELMRIRPDFTISLLRREINFISQIKDGSKKIGELHINRAHFRTEEGKNPSLIKILFAISAVMFCALAILPFTINNDTDKNYYTSSTSIVEQMGFPTDDYGLLKVD